MKLIDMKNTVTTKDSSLVSPVEQDEYPWGLRIVLDNDTLKKLGIAQLPAIDSEHKLVALACVVGITMNESAGDDEPTRSITLQIEQLALAPAKEEDDSQDDPARAMYPSMLG